jgi:hypothetical protein
LQRVVEGRSVMHRREDGSHVWVVDGEVRTPFQPAVDEY